MLDKYSILLTGAAGFIGSHLAESLLYEGHRVNGLDNFDPFYDKGIKLQNLAPLMNKRGFQFIEADIRNLPQLNEVLKGQYDLVIHLAAKAGVQASLADPNAYMRTNIEGTHNLLEYMHGKGISKLLFASSSSVYGNSKDLPFQEAKSSTVPISPYAFTKLAGEMLAQTYHHQHGLDVINLRLFTVYGPRQRPDLAIHKFSRKQKDGQPIQMYGDGSSARDYTYVGDTIAGITSAMHRLMEHSPLYETFNLGNSSPVKLSELIKILEQASGKPIKVEQLPMQEGDVDITYADISRARELLGYEPKTPFSKGISKFTEWFQATYG